MSLRLYDSLSLHCIHTHLQYQPQRSLVAGDEIIEWNGRSLHNKSAEEVYDIIDESRLDAQVELIVCRSLLLPTGASSIDSGGSSSNVSPSSACSGSGSSVTRRSSANFPHSALASSMAGSAVVSSGGRYLQRKGEGRVQRLVCVSMCVCVCVGIRLAH